MCCRGLLVGVLCLLPVALRAQDLVVTHGGDSINCRITNVWGERLSFIREQNGRSVPMELGMSEVAAYRFNYFSPPTPLPAAEQPDPRSTPSRWGIGLGGGYAYRLAQILDNLDKSYQQHLRRVKNGHYFDADVELFFGKRRSSGMGLNLSRFVSNATSDKVRVSDGYGRVLSGRLEERATITYVGPFGSSRLMTDRHTFTFRYGIGLMFFTDEVDMAGTYAYMKSNTLGLFGEFGYGYRVGKHMSVGGKLSILRGSVTEGKVTDQRIRDSYTRYSYVKFEQAEGLGLLKLGFEVRFDF